MSKHEPRTHGTAPGGTAEDPREERLRTLFGKAYQPVDPSGDLRRRVAVVTRSCAAQAARRNGGWRALAGGWAPVVAGVMTLLFVLLGMALARWDRYQTRSSEAPHLATQPPADRIAPGPRPVPLRLGRAIQRPVVLPARTPPHSRTMPSGSEQTNVGRRVPGQPAPVPKRLLPAGGDDRLPPGHDPLQDAHRGVTPPADEWGRIEAQVRRTLRVRDDFVRIPFPQIASTSDRQIAAAVESYKQEAAIVDSRLSREITLQQKAMALSDLCERLRSDTGIPLGAGSSIADEKVTVFCEKLPLRDVMRQLSRPFGYTWLRSRVPARGAEAKGNSEASGAGAADGYRYELVQDLRSQLLEEELRNRERNATLLALEREMERFRPYLGLSPDEALTRSKTAPEGEKKRLEQLGRAGWGPIQMYFRLSAQDLATLRSGQQLTFNQEPQPGQKPLPPDVARGVFQSFRDWRLIKRDDRFDETWDLTDPRGLLLTAVPQVRAAVKVGVPNYGSGQFWLDGASGAVIPAGYPGEGWNTWVWDALVRGSAALLKPDNETANAKLAHDPALRPRVTVQPQASCPPASPTAATLTADGSTPEPKVTSADVLEALHRSTGSNLVADSYTRLYKPEAVSVRDLALFDALNRLADTMGLRWGKEQRWLQFRSTTFFNDRLKEVPNRLLSRWATARRKQGMLSLDDLVEIAGLTNTQLGATSMAEGARECYGLAEWGLLHRPGDLRPHLRFLAGFTPEQRQETMSPAGLPFVKMPLAQQQRFLELALGPDAEPLRSPEELAGAALRVEYTPAGWFQFGEPGALDAHRRWVVSLEPGPQGRRAFVPPVRGRTREAALQALLQIDPQIREALLRSWRRADPRVEAAPPAWETQIHPTRLDLTVIYIPGTSNARPIRWVHPGQQLSGGGG